ncbi:MAG: hypothetical protein KIS66_08250 [Fimbriimonadaceae bacterium]|nr:hypothetical protein [Fimbriimonadaceae bacterium]
MDQGDASGALDALAPVLDLPGREAARLLAIEVVSELSPNRQRALLQRWRKASGWTVKNGDATWKRDDLALAHFLLAERTARAGSDRASDPESQYGTGVGFLHVASVRAKLVEGNDGATLWRSLATVAFMAVFGDSPVASARAQVERVIRGYSTDPYPYLVGAYLYRSRFVSARAGKSSPPDTAKAEGYATRAMALGPDLATPPYVLGQMWLVKDPKKAEEHFRKFVAIQKKAGRSVERERAALARRGFRLPE